MKRTDQSLTHHTTPHQPMWQQQFGVKNKQKKIHLVILNEVTTGSSNLSSLKTEEQLTASREKKYN